MSHNTIRKKNSVGIKKKIQILSDTNQKTDAQNRDFGFKRLDAGSAIGWLFNMEETTVIDEDSNVPHSAIDFYFIGSDNSGFCCCITFEPYFYIRIKEHAEREVESLLLRKYEGVLNSIETMPKEDLDVANHLCSGPTTFLKLNFRTSNELNNVRRDILHLVEKNRQRDNQSEPYQLFNLHDRNSSSISQIGTNTLECLNHIIDIREHDVPYLQRVCIDKGYRCGLWYEASVSDGETSLAHQKELIELPDVTVLAFDIETTKAPLKFPNAECDSVMMISYMIGDQGYLIVNREIVSENVEDFEYTPKPEFKGVFTVFNVPDEETLLKTFFTHIRRTKPVIYVTYNGDFFDWPFIDTRAQVYGMVLAEEIGVWKSNDEYKGRFCVHLDAFQWVKRDSYLPQGSQGLKAVTKAKLNYNPLELDPEDMLPFASENPQLLASYSVSDAVATYYLYMKYVHAFIFSLGMIIPMNPGDVLRKGSGTLCELLLMARAFDQNIVAPNKQVSEFPLFYKGKLLDSETYIGGHVECIESGVFRDDVEYDFELDTAYLQELIDDVPEAVKFCVENEFKKDISSLANYDDVVEKIVRDLTELRDRPKFCCPPLIYHLDVGAMYPNIILTNRLQPMAVIDQKTCASCDYNIRSFECQRRMNWTWRGKYYPATRSDFNSIKAQIEAENISKKYIPKDEYEETIMKRVKEYSQKVYKKIYIEESEDRQDIVCQRENSFYVDTVRDFRDRRYEYKELKKKWSKAISKAGDSTEVQKCKNLEQLYDSLQLAHKCILNSFYGYVMRRGARWFSMEMAGIVTSTGANIIKDSRIMVEKIGRPLELDTDGIWCILPKTFPENYELVFRDGEKEFKATLSYPCTILNQMVHRKYSNDQYLTLTDKESRSYVSSKENTIFFEVDGPYKAMLLPAAQEEGKSLKKRYAVFDHNGNITELKGFEIKRRGELQLIKVFQSEVFPAFLNGSNLLEIYQAVASVANRWIDVLDREGVDLEDQDLFELLSESRVMSQSLKSYEGSRSTSITAATRLAEFLGQEVVKDKGLNCTFVISKWPQNSSVSGRAIPIAIFSAEQSIMIQYLKRWTGVSDLIQDGEFDVRMIMDWDYYKTRLGSAIQKIITIPAAMQNIENPVPRVQHPDWVARLLNDKNGRFSQQNLGAYFKKIVPNDESVVDIEEIIAPSASLKKRSMETAASIEVAPKAKDVVEIDEEEDAEDDVDLDENFQQWHLQQKKFWKSIRSKKSKGNSQVVSKSTGKSNSKKQNNNKVAVASETWDIVQIVPSQNNALKYLVWIVVNGKMRCVQIKHTRNYYINSRKKLSSAYGPETQKILPRGKRSFFLHHWKVDENYNIEEIEEAVVELLSHPEIEGVYESKIDPITDIIMQIGISCKPSNISYFVSSKPASHKVEITLNQISSNLNSNASYLTDSEMKRHFLYISRSKADGKDSRGVFAFFTDKGDDEVECLIIAINPYRNRIDKPNFESILKSVDEEKLLSSQTINFKFEQVNNFSDAFKQLNAQLMKISVLSGDRPDFVLCQSSFDSNTLRENVSTLYTRFPLVVVPYNSEDDQYPALNWLSEASKPMFSRFIQSSQWLENALKVSNYCKIPIGNLKEDMATFSLDMLFARVLRQSQHLLWNSSFEELNISGFPEKEDFFEAEVKNPEISFSGFYNTPCFELIIDNFASNSILLYHVLQTIEGCGSGVEVLSDKSNDKITNVDGFEVDFTFKLLRSLVQTLFHDVMQSRSEVADFLIQNLYRWIRSPSSTLHDPLLYRLLHVIMSKFFVRLCAQFKDYGANLVYCSFSKIIINASKPFVENATSFTKYVIDSILSNELFVYLTMDFGKLWESLIFLDHTNYSGIIYQNAPETSEGVDNSSLSGRVFQTWTIADYLPDAAKDYFLDIVYQYLVKPYIHRMDLIANNYSDRTTFNLDESKKQSRDFLARLIRSNFTQHLLEIVDWMKENLRGSEILGENESADVFPRLPGSYLSLKNPTLEFIKTVSHVISLDEETKSDSALMKTTLLKIIGVLPFSPEARFVDPCQTYVLTDVICSFCNQARDFDMCRDPNLLQRDWNCTICGHEFDAALIESLLIQKLQRVIASYQVQDLKCKLCKSMQTDNLNEFCKCSGALEPTISESEIRKNILLFSNISEYYEMAHLSALTEVFHPRVPAE